MALNIFAKPVKSLFKKQLPRIPVKRCSKKQSVYGSKSKTCNFMCRHTERKKYKTLLSFRTNLLSNNPRRGTYPLPLPLVKYCTKSRKCEVDPPGRHLYHQDTENAMNQQINAEFNAAFAYLSMACYFGRTDVALTGCQGFFMNMYQEELDHATVLLNFQLMRGANVLLLPINVPEKQDWQCIVKAFSVAVEMEKFIKEKLCAMFEIAEKHKDLQVMDLISTQFMEEQNRSISDLARLLTKAKMTDTPVGTFLFDNFVFNSFVKKSKGNLMYKTKLDPKDGGT